MQVDLPRLPCRTPAGPPAWQPRVERADHRVEQGLLVGLELRHVAVPQHLDVARRGLHDVGRRLPAGLAALPHRQGRADLARLLPRHRARQLLARAEPRLEDVVVAHQVVRAAAQRRPARPEGRLGVVGADQGGRLEEAGRAVVGDRDPGRAQRPGEPEQDLVGLVERRRWSRLAIIRSSACFTRSVSSRYFTTAPSVLAAVSRSSSSTPSRCSARAQSSVSATPGGLSSCSFAQPLHERRPPARRAAG